MMPLPAAHGALLKPQQLCAGRPDLLLESLIMAQQFDTAREILQQAPHLQSNVLLRQYARHAPSCHLTWCNTEQN